MGDTDLFASLELHELRGSRELRVLRGLPQLLTPKTEEPGRVRTGRDGS